MKLSQFEGIDLEREGERQLEDVKRKMEREMAKVRGEQNE